MTQSIPHVVFSKIRQHTPKWFWSPLRRFMTALLTPIRFSLNKGHWKSSIRGLSVDAKGDPIPWYTYPAIDFLHERDFRKKNVLEFGGGQSTLWWSARSNSVLVIEQDANWAKKLKSQVNQRVKIHHVPADYETRDVRPVKRLLDGCGIAKFDIIIVDGYLRQELAAMAFEYVAENGAIILDDAEHYGFLKYISCHNCQRVDFFGFAPGVSLQHCTSIVFFKECFLFARDIPIPKED